MRLTGSRAYYRPAPPKMPPGLVELMEGLTKEVLKNNPTDIYGFCADHVEQLLEKRDGPSPKKLFSLDEKIVRAQEKVRQRAEKRRQEYDRNILMHKQNSKASSSNDSNDDITLHVPQLFTAQEPHSPDTISDKDNATSPQHQIDQNIVKAPVHECALENSSEVVIIHEATSAIYTPRNDDEASKKNIHENDIKTKVKNDMINEFENMHVVQSDKTNVITIETIPTEIPEIGTKNINEDDSEVVESTNMIESADSLKTVISIEQLNELASDDILATEAKLEEVSSTVDKVATPVVTKDKNSGNIAVEIKDANIEIKDDISKSKIDNNIQDTSIQTEDEQPSNHAIDNQEYHNTEETDKVEHANNTGLDQAEDMRISTQIENSKQSPKNVHSCDSQMEKRPSVTHESHTEYDMPHVTHESHTEYDMPHVTHESHTEYDIARTKSEIQRLNNTAASEVTNVADHSQFVDNNDVSNNQENASTDLIKNDTIMEIKESINTAVSESETHLDLPTPGIDSDVSTLVTDNSKDDADSLNVINKTTSHIGDIAYHADMPMSQVQKENVDLEKVTSDHRDLHDTHNNFTDPIGNLNDVPTQNSDADNDKETSGNVNDNTQNDNSDTSNMDLETAAITIQKVFRNFLFKSRGSTFEDTANDEANFLDEDDKNKEECDFPITSALNMDRRAHGITRMDTVLQTVNEEKSLSLSTDDSSTLSSAATVIQAHVRGFLVRNRLNSNKTVSTNSLAASNSNEPSITSLDADNHQNKNKTILNIHIVPEGENYLSRDESLITSMELSLDSSPPSSINLHPLGYDKSERRKQLKREDAIQSISPPSNNSGKLSEDFDSVKELSLNDHDNVAKNQVVCNNPTNEEYDKDTGKNIMIENGSIEAVLKSSEEIANHSENIMDDSDLEKKRKKLIKMNSDEMDVVTPYISNENTALIHSGEFHDAVLPTRVSRSDTSVVSEFKNVLVYFLLWNHS